MFKHTLKKALLILITTLMLTTPLAMSIMTDRKPVNFYDLPPLPLAEENFIDLLNTDGVRIERIVSTGQASPPDFWYDQPQHEWVIVIQGQATITVQENGNHKTHTLKSGDSLFLPAHQKHRVDSTTTEPPTLWLAVFIEPK